MGGGFFLVARGARARFDPTYSTYCTAHAGPYVTSYRYVRVAPYVHTNQTGLLACYQLPGPVRKFKTMTSKLLRGLFFCSKLLGTYIHIGIKSHEL